MPGTRRGPLAGGGRHSDDRPILRAVERTAHRDDVVSRHGLGGPCWACRWRRFTPTGSTRAWTGCCRTRTQIEKHLKERLGDAVRPGVRPAVVRRDQHVFRGPVRGQRPGEARLLARQPARLPASLHRPGGDRPTAFRWATRSSPATATMRRRWKRSSRRWSRNTAGPIASG